MFSNTSDCPTTQPNNPTSDTSCDVIVNIQEFQISEWIYWTLNRLIYIKITLFTSIHYHSTVCCITLVCSLLKIQVLPNAPCYHSLWHATLYWLVNNRLETAAYNSSPTAVCMFVAVETSFNKLLPSNRHLYDTSTILHFQHHVIV
jgi:hypothetical protein